MHVFYGTACAPYSLAWSQHSRLTQERCDNDLQFQRSFVSREFLPAKQIVMWRFSLITTWLFKWKSPCMPKLKSRPPYLYAMETFFVVWWTAKYWNEIRTLIRWPRIGKTSSSWNKSRLPKPLQLTRRSYCMATCKKRQSVVSMQNHK